MSVPTAQELLESQAFQRLVSVGLEIIPAHLEVIRNMETTELHDHQDKAQTLVKQLRTRMKERSEISETELSALADLGGLTPDQIRSMADRVHTQGTKLGKEFPELAPASELTRNLLLFEALTHHEPTMTTIKEAALNNAGEDQSNVCKAKCLLTFMLELIETQIDAVKRMVTCTVLIFPPLVMLCASIMIVLMISAMTKANEEYTECIADCEESRI